MPESRRQEVFNVVLAQLLQERGVIAAPESIVKAGPEKVRHMPDVIVTYQGLRTAIEAEVESATARDKALASASRRVAERISDIGIAVVYPERLRGVDFAQLKQELERAELAIAVASVVGNTGYTTGDVAYLERALRSTFEQLIREDVVVEAVAQLDYAVDKFAGAALNYPGIWGRISLLLNDSLTLEDLPQLSAAQKGANCRIAGLVLINAMIFQEVLHVQYPTITPMKNIVNAELVGKVLPHPWQYILENINYYPIFHLAVRIFDQMSMAAWDIAGSIRYMAGVAETIAEKRTALRHDLMGRVYHRLLAEAKYLGTYYTSIPAATLLLQLALRPQGWPVQWADPQQIGELRIADLSCGTGTLLTAAADAVIDNYVNTAAAEGKPVQLDAVHRQLAESVLYGYDVLPSAIHLTASTLALRAPDTPFKKMNLFSLPLGGQFRRLGSIEFLRGRQVQMALDLFGGAPQAQQVTGTAVEEMIAAPLPDLDLCVMNPPFVRSVGGNLLFGSRPEHERTAMQRDLKNLVSSSGVQASITAGLGSVFVAIGDRYIKPGGRLALVLPKALLSGVAWGETRELINRKYRLDYIVVSHDAERWNFSESTDLSEVLLVATRNENANSKPPAGHQVVIVNLWRNPTTALEALAVASSLAKGDVPDLVDGQGALLIPLNGHKGGEAIAYAWDKMQADWFLPAAFAQSDLTRAAYHLLKGNLWLPGFGQRGEMKLCPLSELGKLGPDRRDIHDGFDVTDSPTAFPAFWGHNADTMLTLAQTANKYLAPLAQAKKSRPLRKVEDLWPLAGTVLLAERMWLKTQRLVSVHLPQPALSNVWWPFAFKSDLTEPNLDKAFVLWLNSTLGLLILLATRDETRGAWIDFKKPSLGAMPVLDMRALSPEQLAALAEAYDRIADQPLQPFPHMADDAVRASIDTAIAQALNLPDYSALRTLLGREPVVSMQRL